jgi:hypothetical protein
VPVRGDGLAEFFCVGLPSILGNGDAMRLAVGLRDVGMVDRDVGDALVELVDRVPRFAHHAQHKAIRLHNRVPRFVHEFLLQGVPLVAVPAGGLSGQRRHVELGPALFAGLKIALSGLPII